MREAMKWVWVSMLHWCYKRHLLICKPRFSRRPGHLLSSGQHNKKQKCVKLHNGFKINQRMNCSISMIYKSCVDWTMDTIHEWAIDFKICCEIKHFDLSLCNLYLPRDTVNVDSCQRWWSIPKVLKWNSPMFSLLACVCMWYKCHLYAFSCLGKSASLTTAFLEWSGGWPIPSPTPFCFSLSVYQTVPHILFLTR